MIKIVFIAIICAIIIVYLKSTNSELALLATIGASIIVIFFTIDYLAETYDFLNKLISLTGVDNELYVIIFKITAIGYLIEFGASIIEDFGVKSLADKLVFAGKLIIFSISLPILYAVFNLLIGLLQ